MTGYEQIDTLAHIKRIDVLGIDPMSGNLIIEIHAGPQRSETIKRYGAFSISRDALKQFLPQADAELAEASTTTAHNV